MIIEVIMTTKTRTPNANLKIVLIMNIIFRFPIQNLFDPPLHIKVSLLRIYKDFQLYDQQILIDHNHSETLMMLYLRNKSRALWRVFSQVSNIDESEIRQKN
jgi:hypothetical protein